MAFDNVRYDERLDDSDGEDDINARYLLIGFDRNVNLLEILYISLMMILLKYSMR